MSLAGILLGCSTSRCTCSGCEHHRVCDGERQRSASSSHPVTVGDRGGPIAIMLISLLMGWNPEARVEHPGPGAVADCPAPA